MVLGNPPITIHRLRTTVLECGKNLAQISMAWHGECCELRVWANLGSTGRMPFSSTPFCLPASFFKGRKERKRSGGRKEVT